MKRNMNKFIFACAMTMLTFAAQASGTYDLDFEAQKSQYPDMIVSWQVVNDVPQVCAQAAAIRGIRARYNPHMIACALTHRNGTACIIFTQKKLSLAILGHELRHCFEGAWHD